MMRCTHCNGIFREEDVPLENLVARYGDCDVYKAPCCGTTVDNRLWKSLPDMQRVERGESPYSYVDEAGRYVKVRHA